MQVRVFKEGEMTTAVGGEKGRTDNRRNGGCFSEGKRAVRKEEAKEMGSSLQCRKKRR